MVIPREWLAEAGLDNFMPVGPSYRCTKPHVLVPLENIERIIRANALDANGFRRDRMMRILVGIRSGDDIAPSVPVENISLDRYSLRDGTHRFYASLALGFSHLPVEICVPL